MKGCEKRARRALCCEGGGVERAQQAAYAALCRAAVPFSIAPIVNISIGSIATVAIDMRLTIRQYDTTFRLNLSSPLPMQSDSSASREKNISGGMPCPPIRYGFARAYLALNSFIPGTAPVAGITAGEALAFRACAASTVITGSTATGAGST